MARCAPRGRRAASVRRVPALIFDLDGTLVDTVYAHVFAWQKALSEQDMAVDGWKIHRRIGMSGGLFTRAVGRELGRELSEAEAAAVQDRHGELYAELLPERRALPGATELLAELRAQGVVHGIATSGRRPGDRRLAGRDRRRGRDGGGGARRHPPRAKPWPGPLPRVRSPPGRRARGLPRGRRRRLGPARRPPARMLSIGLLSGGYGGAELTSAGAFRVYRDAAELHASLDELGV